VNTCISGARTFGDFNDPDSKVSKLLKANKVSVLKPELGTKPLVYYIGDVNEELTQMEKMPKFERSPKCPNKELLHT
jgi:Fe-S-cluster-containing dehydrogenase component